MKHLLLAALLLLATSAFAADTPAKIAEDYRKQAAAALTKVNDTLEKATVPLVAALVKAGDTEGADELREQMKARMEGGPVAKPHASAAALFTSYDAARMKALEPAQKAAISRIDAMLASSEGKKMEVVAELAKVRAETAAGKGVDPVNAGSAATASAGLIKEWTYHLNPNAHVSGTVVFDKNGTLKLDFPNNKDGGSWKKTPEPDTYELNVNGEVGQLKVTGQTAEWKRKVGLRYLKAKEGSPML